MKPSTEKIESLLRAAPRPLPPTDLKQELIADISLPEKRNHVARQLSFSRPWWTRWWPSLATGGLAAACLVVMGAQENQIQGIRHSIDQLQQQVAQVAPAVKRVADAADSVNAAANDRAELNRLRQLVQELSTQVDSLQTLRAENQRLRAQLDQQANQQPQITQEIAAVQENANRILCINNLKQLGLAVRVWATDNSDQFPPDIRSLKNELGGAAKVLTCPSDPARKAAESWDSLTPANISYEYLGADANLTQPDRVMFRCPVHGAVTLCDGSVQSISLSHPELLEQRDGKLYLKSATSANAAASVTTPSPARHQPPGAGMSDAMRRRYGLPPVAPDSVPNPPAAPAQPQQ